MHTIHDLKTLAARLGGKEACGGNKVCELMMEIAEGLGTQPGGLDPATELPANLEPAFHRLEVLANAKAESLT